MTTPTTFTQYSTVQPFLGTAPSWVPEEDKLRIGAYQTYEEIYWSSEQGFEEVLRGDNDNPIFMPTARTIIGVVDRYTAPNFGYTISALSPEDGGAASDSTTVQIAQLAFENLFAREQFMSKFMACKLVGLRLGDWVWHVIADDTKPLGRRIKIMKVDPGAYFPVFESDVKEGGDPEKIVKVHLAETITMNKKEYVSRMTYSRTMDPDGNFTGEILRSHAVYEQKDWSLDTAKPISVILAPEPLPSSIPAIPVYHVKNGDPTDPFGSSELRGLESVLLGVNQTVSDEDATLALDGIGIYATDTGAPRDAQGNETDWVFGPGRVLTHSGNLRRVNGASSVAPFGEHYDRLVNAVRQAVGASDVAMGKADASQAESGVALLIELSPILAYTTPKDNHIKEVHAQMFYDLCFWLAEYEELDVLLTTSEGNETVPSVLITPTIGDKIPTNLKAVLDNVILMRSATPALISIQTAHKLLREAGLELEENELDLIKKENEELLANFNGEQDDTTDENRRDAENAGAEDNASEDANA
jgi:hypothetical protein